MRVEEEAAGGGLTILDVSGKAGPRTVGRKDVSDREVTGGT